MSAFGLIFYKGYSVLKRRKSDKLLNGEIDENAKPFFPNWLTFAVLFAALASAGILGYTGKLGGKIRHTEFYGGAVESDEESGKNRRGRNERNNETAEPDAEEPDTDEATAAVKVGDAVAAGEIKLSFQNLKLRIARSPRFAVGFSMLNRELRTKNYSLAWRFDHFAGNNHGKIIFLQSLIKSCCVFGNKFRDERDFVRKFVSQHVRNFPSSSPSARSFRRKS